MCTTRYMLLALHNENSHKRAESARWAGASEGAAKCWQGPCRPFVGQRGPVWQGSPAACNGLLHVWPQALSNFRAIVRKPVCAANQCKVLKTQGLQTSPVVRCWFGRCEAIFMCFVFSSLPLASAVFKVREESLWQTGSGRKQPQS